MDILNQSDVAIYLHDRSIAEGREADNLARWIWEDVLQKPAGQSAQLISPELDLLDKVINRLREGEPIQYIAGHAWFYGRQFEISPDVLIPRPETEELVEWVISEYAESKAQLRILDIGTGSGCIAIMVKLLVGRIAEVVAIDISQKAIEIARINSERLGADITFVQHDFLSDGIAGLGSFDVIISNPPYISTAHVGPDIIEQLRFEPGIALYPVGGDPDIFYKKILTEAPTHLNEGGACFMEINEHRKLELESLVVNQHWKEISFRKDLQGNWRMIMIKK